MAEEKSNSRNKIRIILIIIAILLILIGGGLIAQNYIATKNAEKETTTTVANNTTAEQVATVDNPIDFADLQKQNDEIFAYIKVPDTNVDYPIVQSSQADDFYLKHRASDKKYSSSGAIYIQSLNNNDLKDRVTLIYGHNGYGDTFFTTLHKFEQKDFFDKHPYFYIYTPNSKLTYQVISAFKYDDRHILNSFDMQNDDVFLNFQEMIQNPTSSNKNIRKSLDKNLTIDDNIVVLSTCIKNQKSSRYLVCGVLVNNEKTNWSKFE